MECVCKFLSPFTLCLTYKLLGRQDIDQNIPTPPAIKCNLHAFILFSGVSISLKINDFFEKEEKKNTHPPNYGLSTEPQFCLDLVDITSKTLTQKI